MATGFSVKDALNRNSKAGVDESPKARFRTKDISIFKMYPNEMNFYSVNSIEELAGDILMYGMKQNLELVYAPCDKGEYRIVAGERRWEALKYLVSKGYKEFEIATSKLTTPQDDDEEQVEIIIANTYRDKSMMDMIEEETRLKESLERMKAAGKKIKGYDLQSGRLRDVISSMLHMSKTKIAQIEAVNNNLIPEWKEELKKERLTFSAAYELSGMKSDEQKEVLKKYIETGEITHKDIKEIKGKGEVEENETEERKVSESDTEIEETMNKPGEEREKEEEYQTPHPEGIVSICYSCTRYEKCNVKTGTCKQCDQYRNREGEYKTDEQRYSEEQDKIDRETQKRLKEKREQEKLESLPSKQKTETKYIRAAGALYERILNGDQSFMIVKSDEYKIGEYITIGEFAEGKATGRASEMLITHVEDDTTSSAIDEGYCVINVVEVNEDGYPLSRVDIRQICAELRANGDGYLEGGEEVIGIESAISIIVADAEEKQA